MEQAAGVVNGTSVNKLKGISDQYLRDRPSKEFK